VRPVCPRHRSLHPFDPRQHQTPFSHSPMLDMRSRRRFCPRPRWRRWQSRGRPAQSLTGREPGRPWLRARARSSGASRDGASATTDDKCGFNPADDQAADRAHNRGHASLQLLFGHSRHHGGRPGCDRPQPPEAYGVRRYLVFGRAARSAWAHAADGACDQDEQELRGGDVCGGGRQPAPSRARG
jgi:hypothetical protein